MNPGDFFTNPDFGPFSSLVTGPIQKVISAVWAALLVFALFHMMMGIGRFAKAKKNHRSEDMHHEMSGLIFPVVAVVGLSALPLIITGVMSLA